MGLAALGTFFPMPVKYLACLWHFYGTHTSDFICFQKTNLPLLNGMFPFHSWFELWFSLVNLLFCFFFWVRFGIMMFSFTLFKDQMKPTQVMDGSCPSSVPWVNVRFWQKIILCKQSYIMLSKSAPKSSFYWRIYLNRLGHVLNLSSF